MVSNPGGSLTPVGEGRKVVSEVIEHVTPS